MPEEWDSLAQARHLIVKKNDLFERQGPKARDKIFEINMELDGKLMETIKSEFESMYRKRSDRLIAELSERIKDLKHPEAAFSSLRDIIGNRSIDPM